MLSQMIMVVKHAIRCAGISPTVHPAPAINTKDQ